MGQPSVPNFEKGVSEKNEWLGGGSLKESLPQIFAKGRGGGLSMFLAKKDSKIKYGFEGLIFKCPPWPVLAKEQINF